MDTGNDTRPAVPEKEKTQVFMIGSIHYKLATNPRYSMQYLKDYIRKIDPDVIAMEVNPEHMDCSFEEMNQLYPPEFAEIRKEFGACKTLLPFNWMIKEQLEDRAGFLANNIRMRKEVMAAPDRQGEKAFLNMVKNALDYIGNVGSAADVNSLAWDQLVHIRKQFDLSILKGSAYEEQLLYLSGDLNQTRISTMDQKVKQIIEDNRGKKIAILTGAMHREHFVPFIRENIKDIDFFAEIVN